MESHVKQIDNGFIVATTVMVEGLPNTDGKSQMRQLMWYCKDIDAVCKYLQELNK